MGDAFEIHKMLDFEQSLLVMLPILHSVKTFS